MGYIYKHFRMYSSSEWGTSHEKHIKMAILDNQAKIQYSKFNQNIGG